MKLVVVIRRIVIPKRSALMVVTCFVMGVTVRGDLLSHLYVHRCGDGVSRRAVSQDSNKKSSNQRKGGR